jgi:hypothetical protein
VPPCAWEEMAAGSDTIRGLKDTLRLVDRFVRPELVREGDSILDVKS